MDYGERKRWLETPLWQFNLDITLSEEDLQFCYVLNNITLHFIEVGLQFVVNFNIKTFFLYSSNFRPKTARDPLDF